MKKRLCVLTVLTLLMSCSKQTETKAPAGEVLFEVNPVLLGDLVRLPELKLTMHPPKDWTAVDEALFKTVCMQLQAMYSDDAPLQVKPHRIFLNNETQSMLSISAIQYAADSMAVSRAMDYFEKNSPVDQGDRKMNRMNFVKDQIYMEQLLVHDQLRIAFKLVMRDGTGGLIVLDYTTLRTEYEKEVKAIESSIGSIIYDED